MKKILFPLFTLLIVFLFSTCEDATGSVANGNDLSSFFSYDPTGIYGGPDDFGNDHIGIIPLGYDFSDMSQQAEKYIDIEFEGTASGGTYQLEDLVLLFTFIDTENDYNEYWGISGTITVSDDLKLYELDDVVLVDEDLNPTDLLTGSFSLTTLLDISEY